MSDEYIERLERENEELRKEVERAHALLENVWSDSRTMGLVPNDHFFPLKGKLDAHMYQKCRAKKFNSLRAAREHVLSAWRAGKKVYIKMIQTEDGRDCVYDEKIIDDYQGNPIVVYLIHHCIIDDKPY